MNMPDPIRPDKNEDQGISFTFGINHGQTYIQTDLIRRVIRQNIDTEQTCHSQNIYISCNDTAGEAKHISQ